MLSWQRKVDTLLEISDNDYFNNYIFISTRLQCTGTGAVTKYSIKINKKFL